MTVTGINLTTFITHAWLPFCNQIWKKNYLNCDMQYITVYDQLSNRCDVLPQPLVSHVRLPRRFQPWHLPVLAKVPGEMESNRAQEMCDKRGDLVMSGFFDAFPAPRDSKSANFLSFYLEFWVFTLSFEFFPWVLIFFAWVLSFFPWILSFFLSSEVLYFWV